MAHKKSAISQMALAIATFGSLESDNIGFLDERHNVGGLVSLGKVFSQPTTGPFTSAVDFFKTFFLPDWVEPEDTKDVFRQIYADLDRFFNDSGNLSCLQQPFCLVRPGLDAQNFLFVQGVDGSPLWLTGFIDFEATYTGP